MSTNSKNKEEAYNGIKGLVEKFENNYKQFHSSDYNETLTRQDFINPFFEYLGWDISNKEGLSQTYRDVIHEDKLKIGKETKAPDYSFRIGGNRVFFVEAKKPSRNLKEDSDAAYQIRRYAWSGKLAVSILTDFEEFAIYDCSKKPSPNDKASMSRIEYINYEDYLNRFDFLYDTFAKENVLRGSLEKYNADTKSKKGTESVDIDFLNSLDDLRTKLASNISKLNSLSLRDLNFAVQHIIDRIIFLRVAEDRGVENYGDLREACCGNNYYKNIVDIFKKSDGKYNSGIFDFSKDKITQNIEVDNKVIKEIINDLYYPKSPYEFSVISVEIIGNAYEQFLGKTITIGKNNASRRDAFGESGQMPKAKIELKPEVRKAGGVYYTPEYIVDYIVENTVGEKIKGKTPKEIANIKIVDPACGSGSFLIGAYKYLLNYHREYYSKQGKKKFLGSKEDAITEDGELALWVKKQILINNIFGVDIDSNAVEVTKLSLLLKCMENETPASIMNNQSLFNERALPSLDENIKCGNSLIGNDFYSGGDSLNIDIETQYKINCFDWEREFSSIFKSGGFDIVIGNPPYVDSEEMVKSNPLEREYCALNYKVTKGNWDLYCAFSEKSINLLKSDGYFGYIIPNKFLSLPYGEHLRLLFSKYYIKNIIDYSSVSVFVSNNKKINVYPIVIIINKSLPKNGIYNKMISEYDIEYKKEFYIDNTFDWSIKFNKEFELIDKVIKQSKKLNEDFILENSATVSEAYELKKYMKDNDNIENSFKFINTGTIDRYNILWGVYETQYIKDKYKYPTIKKDIIKKKFPKRYSIAIKEKIISAGMVKRLEFCYDNSANILSGKSTTVILNKEENLYNLKYIIALLNSKLYNLVFKSSNKHNAMSGGYMNVNKNSLSQFIYYPLDFNNKKDKEVHDKLVKLVDNIIAINKKLVGENNPNTKEILERQVRALDGEIDRLVYGLYGLTEEEIDIIEGKD
ncbi:methyltransferase [Brachyspira aalborgi]|uniref:site-specific DNA-methyltransferase (adenine-specific) n=1 Tax=Brachyspira aalborgi TaxID=29522 RepID=A0A5C8EA02_9SPIR|nr:DNA methyltransferase [Brachyspira aalborgi]TXJ34889.1 methyltransferase [Brachyspira aalborgi]